MDNFPFLDNDDSFFSENNLPLFPDDLFAEETSISSFTTFTSHVHSKENDTDLDVKKNFDTSGNISNTIISSKKSVSPLINNNTTEKQKILNQFLRIAIEKNISELIGELVQIGADPNCTYDDNFKPLFLCANHGNLDCFEVLYSNGARLDESVKSGQTALHAAICAGNINMLKKMITLDPDKFNMTDTTVHSPKLTLNPLYLAILYDAIEILNFIFSKSETPIINQIITQCFPLHYAVVYAKPKSVETLLKFVHVDYKNKSGYTPLMLVAKHPNTNNNADIDVRLDKIVDLLIQHNADLNALSTTGMNVYQIASFQKKDALVKKLTQLNKKPIRFTISPNPIPLSSNQPRFVPTKKNKIP